MCSLDNEKMFQQLITEIVKIYGDLLVSVILYGSVARGTQTSESDIDIAVMLRRWCYFMSGSIKQELDFELKGEFHNERKS